jgi:Tfp pilus assembly protein PilF
VLFAAGLLLGSQFVDARLASAKQSRPDASQVGAANRHAEQAKQFLEADQPSKALREINFAIKLNPRNADFAQIQGQIYERNKQEKEALAAYDRAIEIDSQKKRRFKEKMAACKRFGNISEYFKTRERFLLYDAEKVP